MRVKDHADYHYQYQGYQNAPNQSTQAENPGPQDSCGQNQKRRAQQTSPVKRAFEQRGSSSLYSSTRDLMSIANTEDQEILRGIYVRLSFKLWSVRAAGATGTDTTAIKSATRSIQKVMGKVKSKIKGLRKELELEKKAENARKAKQRRLQQELRRELAIKRKIRKEKERRDVAESYLESGGQYSEKSYRDDLPLEVLLEMEMQRSGYAGTADAALAEAAVGMAVTETAAAVPMDVSAAVGNIVDVAL